MQGMEFFSFIKYGRIFREPVDARGIEENKWKAVVINHESFFLQSFKLKAFQSTLLPPEEYYVQSFLREIIEVENGLKCTCNY